MTEALIEVPRARAGGRRLPIDKFNARRSELSEAVLKTLGELGYARTSLREIAQKSEFTHGVFHYYFTDKIDLICCSVRQYKAKCVTRYDEVTATARTREQLIDGFLDKLAETLRQEADMHRLWYDLRAQALFESAFREDVTAIDKSLEDMIWRVASRLSELTGKPLTMSSPVLYAVMDGLFQKALLKFTDNQAEAIPELIAEVRRVLAVAT
ncbi:MULTISPECIES: TetR/AcrR family transcriptional regulator [Phyllobacteriaceae]|jgi:AcrR family transcriptional regulator|uniref:TetR family transcriptional regulator n=1 Tax=Mesorhizobium hungaricum TaxID=1566387 RepID=A0A1C2DYJ3_9HYPH|nr:MULTISPECIES: TetR/AcrR family transcriptional regulator [Mesorhizobium]MBN9234772.1 TetR/AcrR family transcriptional regulator [Mesorhizobium sp.]MDQ0328747.1 AcrR family transcriptional regulator [Mesorhizobium sp. YL-MeA3-2017]OCX19812.1 TetR family transcriptional regulator [Mesorhizobium hungaricum]